MGGVKHLLVGTSILVAFVMAARSAWMAPEIAAGYEPPPAASPTGVGAGTVKVALDFNRDIRPILSDHCFRCHGTDPDSRKHGLRLDVREVATSELDSGMRAIVPGDVEASEAVRRIMSEDPDEVMPPPDSNTPLSKEQRETLVRWIREGAEYQAHWAFVAPRAMPVPVVKDQAWARDEIDRVVLARLEEAGIVPAPEADRATLLRRVSLALTGLGPSPEETAAFIGDKSPGAYERRVDALLGSVRYGERMAADWLDVARFADTLGYQSDRECRTWPWRDWLIGAFNANLAYDQFIRDQIAGDLVPGATREQRVATAFMRLHRQTNEGGSIDDEFRQEYVSDRVQTFGTAFLGLTVECARCHDHKYDPIPQVDYYSLCAFLGDIDESGTYAYTTGAVPGPTMRLPTREQEAELARLGEAQRAAEARLVAAREAGKGAFLAWLAGQPRFEGATPVKRVALEGGVDGPGWKGTLLDGDTGPSVEGVPAFRRCDPYTIAMWVRCPDVRERATILHTSTFTIEADQQGYQLMFKDGALAWEIIHFWPSSAAAIRTVEAFPVGRWVHVAVTYDGSSRAGGMRVYLDGALARTEVVRDRLEGPSQVRSFQIGYRDRDLGLRGGAVADLRVFDRELSPGEVGEVHAPGSFAGEIARGEDVGGRGMEYFLGAIDGGCREARGAARDAHRAYQDLLESIPELMVMEQAARPRAWHVLARGQYDMPELDRPVGPDRALEGVLAFGDSRPRSRLGLAQWVTDPLNPLTARVAVNRLWAICFGRGLVPTVENFGVQGESPSHPQALDILAADFVRGGWDVKATLRRIVLSATFRQASTASAELRAKDPLNLLLSRGPSVRLSAEAIRDQALAASGLLVERVGGPSVKPYQPAGIWEDAGANAQGNGGYVPDTGDNAHRRSLYTYRKRTAPPPSMLAFDAGSREVCQARRLPTNTPLQALVLMNDRVYFECARALAVRAAKESLDEPRASVRRAFALLAAREARAAEASALDELYDRLLVQYRDDPAGVKGVLSEGVAEGQRTAHLASLTLVCSTIIASDAVVTSR